MFDFVSYSHTGGREGAAAASCRIAEDGRAASITDGSAGEETLLCEVSVIDGRATGSAGGDARIYLFRDGDLAASADASIRIDEEVRPGDALLLCTAGLWKYLFPTEIAVDCIKSKNAADWHEYLLVRLAEKTHLAADDFAVICGFLNDEGGTS